MKKEALAQFANDDLILIAFMIFLFSFIGITILAFLKGKKEIAYNESLPLDSKEFTHEQ